MAQEPPPALASAPPDGGHEIPSVQTSIVGRELDLARLRELLVTRRVRLVTITGFGGMGKTRLAIELISTMRDAWQQIWFVSLAHVHQATAARSVIARELEISNDGAVADLTQLSALETGPCLLVLDNFEHVVDAAEQVQILLQTWPLLSVLVTSRSPLNLSGEQVYGLPPLAIDEDGQPGSAVRLFVERARAHDFTASFGADDEPVLQEICRKLQGIPLAIELAAARTPLLSPASMLDALKTQLSLLTAGPRDAPARQRTLRDTIAWSYELLSPADRDMLQGLGVFSGGFTADAVASIFGVSLAETIDRLAALVDSSLVLPSPTPLTAAMRYRLLDPVREFAFERLAESGRLHGIQLAHARYFTQFAEDSVPLYDGPELPKALRATCAEVDNFRVAMAFSFSDGHVEDGVRLAGALWRHWPSLYMSEQEGWHDRLQEGLRWIETALEHRDGLQFDAVREALIGEIYLNAHLGRYEHLQELADVLMAQAMDEGDSYGMYWGAFNKWRASIDITQPVQQIDEALEWLSGFARGTRQPVNQEAGVYLAMGEVLIMQCQERDAGPVITRAHDLALESGNPLYISSTTQLLGDLALERHDLISALGRFRECLLLQNPLGNPSGLYFTITRVAMVALAAGREDLALRLLASQPVQHRAAHLFEARNHQQFLEKLRKVAGDAPVDQALHSQHLLSDRERDQLLDDLDAHLQARPLQSTPASPGHSLTPRELEVLKLLANGASNRSIADSLFISERTVENHVQHIFTKLDVSNRSGATAWAIRNGLA